MKAGEVLHAKTMQLCERNPSMEYSDAQAHILTHDTKLKEAYAMDLEIVPPAGFEIVNPVNAAFIDEVVRRARQAHKDGTFDQLRGELGKLIRDAWRESAGSGIEIGAVLRRLIDQGHSSAPLAAAELSAGQFTQDDPELNQRSSAGIRVVERANKLAESRLAEGKAELTFSGLVQEVLDADPQLKADYTGRRFSTCQRNSRIW